MEDLAREVARLAEAQATAERARVAKAYREYLIDIITQTYDKGRAYTQVVLLALYAGAFSLLSQSGGELPYRALCLICLLLTVSLSAFAINEVYKMVVGVMQGVEQRNLITKHQDQETFLKAYEEYRAKVKEKNLNRPLSIWIACLIISGSSAGLAVGLLFYNLLARILGFAQWPA